MRLSPAVARQHAQYWGVKGDYNPHVISILQHINDDVYTPSELREKIKETMLQLHKHQPHWFKK